MSPRCERGTATTQESSSAKRRLDDRRVAVHHLRHARVPFALGFLAVIGTALAFWAWFTETMRCPLGKVAAWTFLTPVFGVVLGLVFTGERPSGWTAAGMVLVLVSLWTVVR